MKSENSYDVVIPCYNGAAEIGLTIEALLNQSREAASIIVVDDGSSDDSVSIARSFGSRVTVVSQPNRGAAAARYNGVKHASADYVVFNDCGDVSRLDRLASFDKAFARFPDAPVAFAKTWLVEKGHGSQLPSTIEQKQITDGLAVVEKPLDALLQQSWPLAIAMNMAVRTDVAVKYCEVPPYFRAGNDYAMQVQLAGSENSFIFIDHETLEYAETQGGLSKQHGLYRQNGYALCALLQQFSSEAPTPEQLHWLKRRVDEESIEIAFEMLMKKDTAMARRMLAAHWQYGSWRQVVKRLYWQWKRRAR